MSFPYHQLDDSIEQLGSVQNPDGSNDIEDQTFCPSRPLLSRWPLINGIVELVLGFICAGLGTIYVFVVPFLISVDAQWALYIGNNYGAPLWCGLVLIVAGSLAIRVCKYRTRRNVQYFYVFTVVAFVVSLAFMIVILCSSQYVVNKTFQGDMEVIVKAICDDPKSNGVCDKYEKYSVIGLLSYIGCLLGCLTLAITSSRYFMDVMFGEIQLVKSFLFCCCQCLWPYCNLPPSKASSRQSVENEEFNMIV